MRAAFVTLALLAVTHQPRPAEGADNRLVGAWKLVSATASTNGAVTNPAPWGPSPTGILIYTRDGRMSANISHAARKPLSIVDRSAAPSAERAEAFATFLAYAGRYTVTGEKVVHHVEVASVQNWVDTDLVRVATIRGDQLTLRNPAASLDGRVQMFDLVWERLR